jgi:hypothetical protein
MIAEEQNHFNREDRDLLVELRTEVVGIRADIKEIKDGTATKINDLELRIRRLEMWGGIGIGLSLALQFYFNYLK